MEFAIVPAYGAQKEIAELFGEYTDILVARDPAFRGYLNLQGYDEEVMHPERKYGPPGGRLYLARAGEELAGCVALRRLDDERCEMKRLYVRQAFREQGLGERLVRLVIDDARKMGYRHLLLDTLPFLTVAIEMYRRIGFVDIPRYNNSPLDDTVYMGMEL